MNRLPKGRSFKVEVKQWSRRPSAEQLARYWVWMRAIADHIKDSTGQSFGSEEISDAMKRKFLEPERSCAMGVVVLRYPSMRLEGGMTLEERSEYMEQIKMYAEIELGLFLPEKKL